MVWTRTGETERSAFSLAGIQNQKKQEFPHARQGDRDLGGKQIPAQPFMVRSKALALDLSRATTKTTFRR